MSIVKVEICHLPMEYEFKIPNDTPLRELIQYFLDEGQMKKELGQEYGIYNIFDQKLYQGKDLEKKISEISLNQNKVDLKILKREEFAQHGIQLPSQGGSSNQIRSQGQFNSDYLPLSDKDSSKSIPIGNTIKLKIKMIDEPTPLEFILEINKKATFVDLVEQLYSYFKLKREDVTFQLLMGNEYLLGIGEKKLQRPLEDLSIQDYAEIKVKKNWLKQNKQTKFIKIKVKIVDGNNSQNLTIEIDQNDTLGQFIEKLYGHLGHQQETVEFELFMGGNKIQIGQKALRSLYDLSIFDNTEIEVKRQWKGGADKKQVEISYK